MLHVHSAPCSQGTVLHYKELVKEQAKNPAFSISDGVPTKKTPQSAYTGVIWDKKAQAWTARASGKGEKGQTNAQKRLKPAGANNDLFKTEEAAFA